MAFGKFAKYLTFSISMWLTISTVVVASGKPFAGHDCGQVSLDNSKVFWLKESREPVNRKKMERFDADMVPYAFETAIAKRSNLTVEEVMGLVRNFVRDPKSTFVHDNSYGVFVDRRSAVYEVIGNTNLIEAYNWGKKSLKLGKVTPEQIVAIHGRTVREISREEGQRIFRPTQTQFKSSDFKVKLKSEIHPEVAEKLESFGYSVRKVKDGIIELSYSNEKTTPESRLEYFTNGLNSRFKSGSKPKELATYAAQELNLVHTFADGNGRTSRLLGQLIYYQMTGKTILFPREFHKEMDYSFQQLVDSL